MRQRVFGLALTICLNLCPLFSAWGQVFSANRAQRYESASVTTPASLSLPLSNADGWSLPSDNAVNNVANNAARPALPNGPPLDLAKLTRPRVGLAMEWSPEADRVGYTSYDLSVQMPTYPFWGPPPPFLTGRYSFTHLDAPLAFDLPSRLHDVSIGVALIRPLSDQWTTRYTVSAAFSSDLDNTSSDAWRVRAGAFAMYQPNERWTFAFGALATGRDDLPVLPAVGAIWSPSANLKFDLMMPRPRVSFLLADYGDRQQWGYIGAAIDGGAWAYDRADGSGDRLNYREFRLLLGWESAPFRPPGSFAATGPVLQFEVGYLLGREFEFDSAAPNIEIGDAVQLRASYRF